MTRRVLSKTMHERKVCCEEIEFVDESSVSDEMLALACIQIKHCFVFGSLSAPVNTAVVSG